MSLIVLNFLHDTSVLSFYIDIVLTLSIDTFSKPLVIDRYIMWDDSDARHKCPQFNKATCTIATH